MFSNRFLFTIVCFSIFTFVYSAPSSSKLQSGGDANLKSGHFGGFGFGAYDYGIGTYGGGYGYAPSYGYGHGYGYAGYPAYDYGYGEDYSFLMNGSIQLINLRNKARLKNKMTNTIN
ncbi:hypothetical protein BpHYR1_038310 [Brachionus plicatilis]|uniref:Uncharacterized protein n=1 Tax=Brachionus plicatilis TaxID=10195 RepID=A0A3M7RYD6_BRAPC|nr:hypothetical protein BpHYR1_038310 [Brachionus plicatilis]